MKLQIKVIPSSSKDCIAGWLEDTLKVKVKAPQEKGRANKAVIKTLEKVLELPKGSITISSGTSSTRKIIELDGVDEDSINKKLSVICGGQD